MKSDLHHIYPSDVKTNGKRSSYNYGISSSVSDNVSELFKLRKNKYLFQVRKSRRGDIARAHFYMVARYKYETNIFGKYGKPVAAEDLTKYVFDDNEIKSDGCINDAEEAVLKQWHKEDPVDEMEMERNNRIGRYQGNRNPFIDNPELVDRVENF